MRSNSATIQGTDARSSQSASFIQATPSSLSHSEDRFVNSSPQGDAEILLESLEIAGRTPGVSEDILEWPIFGGSYDRTKVETLIFNPHAADYTYHVPATVAHYPSDDQRLVQSVSSDPIRMSTSGRGVQEDDVLRLIDKFLVNVHIKNPILDVGDLKRKARFIVENGFGWDAASCLVVWAPGGSTSSIC